MRTFKIYKATNKINGKSYIGQTIDFEHRKHVHIHRRDGYCDPNSIFHRALDKYGEENFEWEILAEIPGKDFANAFEREMIRKYNTYKPNGYNLTKGGDGGSMWNAIPVVRLTLDGEFVKRYDSACEASDDGFYYGGVLQSCRDPRAKTKGYIFMYEDEYKRKGGRRKEDWPVPNYAKEIIQCDMDGNFIKKYRMIADAERETGISHSSIIGCAKGNYRSAGGYIFVYPEDFPIKDLESHKKKVKGRKVFKVDPISGEILGQYDRMSDAARELGGSHKMIHKVVDTNRTAYGFKWVSQ